MADIVSSPRSSKYSLTESMRGWGDALSLWRLCANAACRRARCCRGNARACFPRNFRLLPEGVQAWFGGIGKAQEQELTWEEAMDWLDTTPAGEAYHEWNETVRASLGEVPADAAPPLGATREEQLRVMRGLDPRIPIRDARPCIPKRDGRDKPRDRLERSLARP